MNFGKLMERIIEIGAYVYVAAIGVGGTSGEGVFNTVVFFL